MFSSGLLKRAALLFSALLCLSAQAQEPRTITIVTLDYPPYSGAKLPEGGALVAIAREAFRRANFRMEISYKPWNRALHEVKSGQTDGIVNIWHSEERAQWLLYSKPLAANQVGLMTSKSKPVKFTALTDLRPYVIGTVRGYVSPSAFDAAKLTTAPSESDEINLRVLAIGRIDAALVDKGVARYVIAHNLPDKQADLVWVEPAIETMPNYLAIAKHVPDAEKIIAAFNDALKSMEKDGTLAAMRRKSGL